MGAPDILIEKVSELEVRATVLGRYIGRYHSELAARAAVLRELESRHGLIPAAGAGAYLQGAAV